MTRVARCPSLLLTSMTNLTTSPAPPPHDATRSHTRNALALIINTGATSVLGALFWFLAAKLYDAEELGQDGALVSAMMLLAVVAELDLGLALPRFLPRLGARSAKAVWVGYAVSSAFAVILAAIAVVLLPHFADSFAFMKGSWSLALLLIVAVVLWNIFAVQDAVLTALRRSSWIPVENTIFGVAKLVLMVVWAQTHLDHGIFVAWVIPMAVMIIPVTVALFKYALPIHARTSPATPDSSGAKGAAGKWFAIWARTTSPR